MTFPRRCRFAIPPGHAQTITPTSPPLIPLFPPFPCTSLPQNDPGHRSGVALSFPGFDKNAHCCVFETLSAFRFLVECPFPGLQQIFGGHPPTVSAFSPIARYQNAMDQHIEILLCKSCPVQLAPIPL